MPPMHQPVSPPADQAPPPPGYQPPYRFTYPMGVLSLVSVVVLLGTMVVVGALAWWLHGQPDVISVQLGAGEMLAVLLTCIGTIVVHELVHGAVMNAFGYRVSYGIAWHMGAAYAAAFHQFITRQHNIAVALAPLAVITPVGLLLLALPGTLAPTVGFTALLINTAGAVGDMYLTWRVLRLPRTTLLYDISAQEMLIYEPLPSAA